MKLLLILMGLAALALDASSASFLVSRKGPSSRIVGGVEATKEDYPPIMSLAYNLTQQELLNNNIQAPPEGGHWHFCGGTIIHRHWVLTAAHCLVNQTERLGRLRVRVGFIDISNGKPLEPGEENFQVEKYVMHPDYDKRYFFSDDVGLIKVNASFEYSRIARVQTSDMNFEGLEATALGWGRTENVTISPVLLKVSPNICEGDWIKDYNLDHLEPEALKKEVICHGKRSSRGICLGDSGGPLIFGPEKTLIGVASNVHQASACGTAGYFQKVSNHIGWIEKTMGDKVNKCPPCSSAMSARAFWLLPVVSLVLQSWVG